MGLGIIQLSNGVSNLRSVEITVSDRREKLKITRVQMSEECSKIDAKPGETERGWRVRVEVTFDDRRGKFKITGVGMMQEHNR